MCVRAVHAASQLAVNIKNVCTNIIVDGKLTSLYWMLMIKNIYFCT